jgi:uncharacterized LabA/DUF88 family protein
VEKVVAYIDGFNLYYGMKDAYGRKYLWLNLPTLCAGLLKPHQQLVAVKYFTARVRFPADTQARQSKYLDALDGATSTEIIYGRLQMNTVTCKKCNHTKRKPEEKKTDVAISAHMVADAYKGTAEAALLISGDSDLVPPVEIVSAIPNRRVIATFPPKRKSHDLGNAAGAHINIAEAHLRKAQLPETITLPSGVQLVRPASWV